MHKYLKEKYRGKPTDYTVLEMLPHYKKVLLTYKLLGQVIDDDVIRMPLPDTSNGEKRLMRLDFKNLKYLANDISRMKKYQFVLFAKMFKPYMPKLTNAMAKRMLTDYKGYRHMKSGRRAAKEHDKPQDYWTITSNQAIKRVEGRLCPMTVKQYDAFAKHVWEKRGSPKYYKKEITGIRFGAPNTFKDRWAGYNIKRYVGVQTTFNGTTKKWGVKMGIVNEKKEKTYSSNDWQR